MPTAFGQNIQIKSFSDIVKASPELKSITTLSKQFGQGIVRDMIGIHIDEIFRFYNEQFDDAIISEVINQVQSIGYYLTGSDIELFKSKCLSGAYGKKFRLSPDVLISWFKEYLIDRQESFAAENQKKPKIKDSDISDKGLGLLKGFADKVKKTELKKTSEVKDLPNHIQKQREMINRLWGEFRSIARNQNEDLLPGKIFIEYEGRKIDFNEFLKVKTQ